MAWRVIGVDYHLLARDLLELFARAGAKVERVDPHTLTVDRFATLFREFQPHLLFGINFAPPLAALCGTVQLPYVSWSIDPLPVSRLEILPGTRPELCALFCHRRALARRFLALGFEQVTWMPLAAPTARRHPVNDEAALLPYRCRVSFVGGSLESDAVALRAQLSEWRVPETTAHALDAFLREVLARSGSDPGFFGFQEDGSDLPPEFLALSPAGAVERWVELLGGRLSQLYRVQQVQKLDSLGVHVYGDAGWIGQVKNYRGPADHGEELTRIYNASTINLDVPRLYQRDIVTMRVFDILSSGGFLLTEANPDLADLFHSGVHLATYSAGDNLREITASWLERPLRCQSVGQAGARHVHQNHGLELRLRAIIELCRERGWM